MSANPEFQAPSVGQAIGVIAIFMVAYAVIAIAFRAVFWTIAGVAKLFTRKSA